MTEITILNLGFSFYKLGWIESVVVFAYVELKEFERYKLVVEECNSLPFAWQTYTVLITEIIKVEPTNSALKMYTVKFKIDVE